MREPLNCDYLYVDDDNGVHLLVPIVAGETIGLDNTCRMRGEMRAFFNGDRMDRKVTSALVKLQAYAVALESDVKELRAKSKGSDFLRQKNERLQQINSYIEILSLPGIVSASEYASFDHAVSQCKTNAIAMRLSPLYIDSCTALRNPLFTLNRIRGAHNFNWFLMDQFQKQRWTLVSFKQTIIHQAVKNTPASLKGAKLVAHLQKEIPKLLQASGRERLDLSKSSSGNYTVDFDFLKDIIGTVDNKTTCAVMAEQLIGACSADDYWKNDSPFVGNDRAETLSIMTQFFIGQACLFARAHGLTKNQDAGSLIENNSALQKDFVKAVITAKQRGGSVELALLNVINKQHKALGFNKLLTVKMQAELTNSFKVHYQIIKDHPHKDEFLIFFPGAPGNAVSHHNRLSMHLVDFLTPEFMNRLPSASREKCALHKRRWLTARRAKFKSVEGQCLPVSNEKHLGSLPEVENPEPLALYLGQLNNVSVSRINDADSMESIRDTFQALNQAVDEIALGRVVRAEQAKLSEACQQKRAALNAARDEKINSFEQEALLRAADSVRAQIESINDFSLINSAQDMLTLEQVTNQLIDQVPSDEAINDLGRQWRYELNELADIKRVEIISIRDQKEIELSPTINLLNQIHAIDLNDIIFCGNELELSDKNREFEGLLTALTEQMNLLTPEQQTLVIPAIEDKRLELVRLSKEQVEILTKESEHQAAFEQVNTFLARIEAVALPVIALDENGNPRHGVGSKAYHEWDNILSEAQKAMPGGNLELIEDAIILKKVTFDSLIEQKRHAFVTQKAQEAKRDIIVREVNALPLGQIARVTTVRQYASEKHRLLSQLKAMELRINALPTKLQLSVLTLFQNKEKAINQEIDNKAKVPPLVGLIETINHRYGAIKQTFDQQRNKINADVNDFIYSPSYRNNSRQKVTDMEEALNQIAQKSLVKKVGRLSQFGWSKQHALMQNERQTIEFKTAVLEAWDDSNSDLYQALNSKRSSIFGYALTFFSGQSWSHCINGDSATIKAMKESDPAPQTQARF